MIYFLHYTYILNVLYIIYIFLLLLKTIALNMYLFIYSS